MEYGPPDIICQQVLRFYLIGDKVPPMDRQKSAYEVMLEANRARQKEALRLQVEEHKSLTEIGQIMGVSRQRAAAMIDKALREQKKV